MIQKLLGFDKQTMRIRTEVIAGITTFLTMSYILAVNPSILGTTGMDKGAVFTATALASPRLYGQTAVRTSSEHGAERIFCFHAGAGHGIFLADGDDGDVRRRGDIHPYYFSEYPGDHT